MTAIINLKIRKIIPKSTFIELNQHISAKLNACKIKLKAIYKQNNKELISMLLTLMKNHLDK